MEYKKYNNILLNKLSFYLNNRSADIKKSDVEEIKSFGLEEEYAVKILLQARLNMDINENAIDKIIFNEYFSKMLKKEDPSYYMNNPYYKNIHLKNKKRAGWEIKKTKYQAYEMFVRDDIKKEGEKLIPSIGYFTEDFYFDAIYENNRLWMSITPNEINTMEEDIALAKGCILTFGLGMGYFAYMCAIKEDVKKVRIVEKDENVVRLFKEEILPKFKKEIRDKIEIIIADAFLEAKKIGDDVDYVYTDIYHDVSDAKDIYLKMKKIEKESKKNIIWRYWIEKTIKLYL